MPSYQSYSKGQEEVQESSQQKSNGKNIKRKCSQYYESILNYLECMQIYSQAQVRKANLQADFSSNTSCELVVTSSAKMDSKSKSDPENRKGLRKKERMGESYSLSQTQQIGFMARYAEDYEKSLSERGKQSYTLKQLQNDRNKQQEEQQMSCWHQIKRLICCQGGKYFKFMHPKPKEQNTSQACIVQESDVSLVVVKNQGNIFEQPHFQEQQNKNHRLERQQNNCQNQFQEIYINQEQREPKREEFKVVIAQFQPHHKQIQKQEDKIDGPAFEKYQLNRSGLLTSFEGMDHLKVQKIQQIEQVTKQKPARKVKGRNAFAESEVDRKNYASTPRNERKASDAEEKSIIGIQISTARSGLTDRQQQLAHTYKLNEPRPKKTKRQHGSNQWHSMEMKSRIDPSEKQYQEIESISFRQAFVSGKKRYQRRMSDQISFGDDEVIYTTGNVNDLVEPKRSRLKSCYEIPDQKRRNRRESRLRSIDDVQDEAQVVETLKIETFHS